ncbi:hypothetical protein [Zobellia nedashkovskayae]|uniref:hypothetical protein n=1 Tax=Zobellia nedashkovskayae TaxID=2779510 RepID=UPI00188C2393|nr:hypothetical protein [Zobellia nedashkovskayae]
MKYLNFLLLLLVSSVSAQNYQYSLDVPKVLEPQLIEAESSLVRIIPQDFDWSNIPTDYSDSVWEIRYNFDLAGQTIILPKNVTVRFNGGVLVNGTVRGDQSIIESNSENQLFDALTLEGTFKSEYLKPQWFGAAMNGTTDDREDFVETLDQAENIGAKVLVDKNMFIDVEETGKKSIFLADNAWLEGANDASIIINNLLSPAFYMALTKNITVKNVTFLYDQQYDATFGWVSHDNGLNIQQLKGYLSETKDIVFNTTNPLWRGPVLYRSTFLIDAAENILFDNVTFKSKGDTADKFIQWAIKLKEEYKPSQTVNNDVGVTVIPKNITMKNVTLDGVIMGIQGVVNGFNSDGLKSKRYSDVQDINGNYVGGKSFWMPPPHLIYLNADNSTEYESSNIEILNTIDYGEYIGSEKVRASVSGYCNSLKLVGNVNKVLVDGYKSYRRDGLWDLQNITDGSFKNIYSESLSNIFNPTFRFYAARFVGTLQNCTFDNITIKDNSAVTSMYPLDFTLGDNVEMNNVNIYVKELTTAEDGPFAIFGSNNTVMNSSLNIENHMTTVENIGVIANNTKTRNFGANNHYEIVVNGWREIESNVPGRCMKLILTNASNTNSNYAKIVDENNKFTAEKVNKVRTDHWVQTEDVIIGSGSSQELKMRIPYNFAVSKIELITKEDLSLDTNVTIIARSTDGETVLSKVSNKVGQVNESYNMDAFSLTQSVHLISDEDLKNAGKVTVSMELTRVTNPN